MNPGFVRLRAHPEEAERIRLLVLKDQQVALEKANRRRGADLDDRPGGHLNGKKTNARPGALLDSKANSASTRNLNGKKTNARRAALLDSKANDRPGGHSNGKKTNARRGALLDTAKIVVLVANPKRANAAKRFSLYATANTVGAYKRAVGAEQAIKDLRWDSKQDFIRLEPG